MPMGDLRSDVGTLEILPGRSKLDSSEGSEECLVELDRTSPLPLYVQIADHLRQRISEGTAEVKHLSDAWLMKQLGVSRMTVRQAIEQLRLAGLVRRDRGKGTTVVTPIEGQLSTMEQYLEEWSVQGAEVTAAILERDRRRAEPYVARVLGVSEREQVGYFRRLRCVDGQPICVDHRFLRPGLLERLSDDDLLHRVYIILRSKLNIALSKADMRILATAAGAEEGRLLGVPRGAPLLERVMDLYAADGRGVLCGPSYFRSDRYVYCTSVTP